MIKTTTLSSKKSSLKSKKAKKIDVLSDNFGPSDFTIQNLLNYSKALEVVKLTGVPVMYGLMN